VAEWRRAGRGAGDGRKDAFLGSLEVGDDLASELEDLIRRELVDQAMERVRVRVSSRDWEAFRLTALERWSGAAAAAHLGIKVAQVHLAKSRVTKRIREQVQRLERDRSESPSENGDWLRDFEVPVPLLSGALCSGTSAGSLEPWSPASGRG
jgi:DNA-directed RNA polymerase specialized sigma24 family protein